MRAGVSAGVSALWGTLSVPPPSSAAAGVLSPAPVQSPPPPTRPGTESVAGGVAGPVSTSFGSALAATTSAISFALSTPQSFPETAPSLPASNPFHPAAPTNSTLLSKLADVDLVRKGASSTLLLKCGGHDVEPLYSAGLVSLSWYRIHKVQSDSGGGNNSGILETATEDPQAHGYRSKYQPLETRASAYSLSIDDIGCRILCVCRATAKGRLLIKATTTTVGIAEFQNETSENDAVESDAKSKVSSGSAYFALEMEGRKGGKAQQADLSVTSESITISSLSELGASLVITFRVNVSTQVRIDTTNSDLFRFLVTSGERRETRDELSEVQQVWLRTHSSSARDLVVATIRLFCGQSFRCIPDNAELLDAPKEEHEEETEEDIISEQATVPPIPPPPPPSTSSQHSHSVASFGSAALAAFSLSTSTLSATVASSSTSSASTIQEADVHSQGRKPQLTMSQIVYVALMAPSPPPVLRSSSDSSVGVTSASSMGTSQLSLEPMLIPSSSATTTMTTIQEEKETSASVNEDSTGGQNVTVQETVVEDLSTKSYTPLDDKTPNLPSANTIAGSVAPLPQSEKETTPLTSTPLATTIHLDNSTNQSSLSSSLESSGSSTSIVIDSDVLPAPPSVSSEQLRNTISSLQKDVADREKRILALETAASVASRQNLERERAATAAFTEERKRASATSSAQLSTARDDTRRATDRILTLEKELAALRARLTDDAASHSLALSEASADKNRQVQAVKSELEAALLRAEASARNEAAANSVAAKLRDESSEAKLEMSRAQEEARNLKVQLAAAALASASSEAAVVKSQEAVAEIERSANALRVERDDLRAAFSTKQAQSETLQQRAQAETEAADLRREVAKERDAVSRQKLVADAADLKASELEKKVAGLEKAIERLDPRIFEEKIVELQRHLFAAKESEEAAVSEKNAANKKYDSVRKDLQRLTAGESGDALKRISIDELKRAKDKLDVKLVKLSDENAALKEELEGLKLQKQVEQQPLQRNTMVSQQASAGAPAPVPSLPGGGVIKSSVITQPSSTQGGGSSGSNSTMVSQLQVLINQLTSDVQEKDEQLSQQKAIKDSLASSMREQATRIADLEKRLGEKNW